MPAGADWCFTGFDVHTACPQGGRWAPPCPKNDDFADRKTLFDRPVILAVNFLNGRPAPGVNARIAEYTKKIPIT